MSENSREESPQNSESTKNLEPSPTAGGPPGTRTDSVDPYMLYLPQDSPDVQRIIGAQKTASEQLDCSVATLHQFNQESTKLMTQVSDQFAVHTVTVMELNKAVAQLEQRVVATKARALEMATRYNVDLATLLPEKDDNF